MPAPGRTKDRDYGIPTFRADRRREKIAKQLRKDRDLLLVELRIETMVCLLSVLTDIVMILEYKYQVLKQQSRINTN